MSAFYRCDCPHCDGTIEYPANGAGEAIQCPHCGEDFALPVATAQTFGPAIEMVPAGHGRAAPKAGTWWRFPLYLAAGLVIAFVAISGIVIVSCVGLIGAGSAAWDKASASVESERRYDLRHLKFEDLDSKLSNSGEWLVISGRIRNTGTNTVNFVKVVVEVKDSSGTVIDTDSTYAISDDLRPGAAKAWDIMMPADSRIARWNARVEL